MAKKSVKAVEADDVAPGERSGSVIAVDRALRLLGVFTVEHPLLALAEMSRLTDMHKTTALRLARTLANARYMVQQSDGSWRLGPAAGWLGARYQASFDVNRTVEPALIELTKTTGESASFYVREGNHRMCLMRIEGPSSIRHHVRIGALIPLADKGAAGRIILAFSGARGESYEEIRRKGYAITSGEREPGVASVAAPVFGPNWRLLGSIVVSGPASRLSRAKLTRHAELVVRAANGLSYALGGGYKADSTESRTRTRRKS